LEQRNGIPSVFTGPSLRDELGVGKPALLEGKPPIAIGCAFMNAHSFSVVTFNCSFLGSSRKTFAAAYYQSVVLVYQQ
jgi:hypothetical protein